MEPLRQQTRIVKWVVWLAFVVASTLIIVAGYVGWWYLGQVRPDGEPGDDIAFTVLETDTVDSLAGRLKDEGLIVDESVFKWYVEQKGGLEITPGFYLLAHQRPRRQCVVPVAHAAGTDVPAGHVP